jgi:flagellar hook assembly protein FlgD
MKIYKILIILVFLGLMGFVSAQALVNLGTAGNYVILTKTGISTTGTTSIVGNIGVSPVSATYITGFGLIMDPSGTFSTSSLVTGRVYAANYTEPTPTNLGTAVLNMQTAYTDAAGRPAGVGAYLNVGGGTLAGQNFLHGTYTWGSNVTITDNITFTGTSTDVWILQISGSLAISSGKRIILVGGARANNIFWQVAGVVTLNSTSEFKGIILAQTNIAMKSGATLNGRALAQTAVTLIANTLTAPTSAIDDININVNPSSHTFVLMPNRPNPFESRTTIQWQAPVSSNVTILIYDATGRVVKTLVNGNYNPGSYTTNWNRSDDNNQTVAAGIYFCEMRANNYVLRHKMIITR